MNARFPSPWLTWKRAAAYQHLGLNKIEEDIFTWIDHHSERGKSRTLISHCSTLEERIVTDAYLSSLPTSVEAVIRPIHEDPAVFREYYERYEQEIKPCIDAMTPGRVFVQFLYNAVPGLRSLEKDTSVENPR
jgi:hypothetical protein